VKFREILKETLGFRDMQVKELAALSGVKKRTLDNYLRENGAEPSAENAVKIAGALGVTVEYLVTGEKTRPDGIKTANLREIHIMIGQMERLNEAQKRAVINLLKVI
jgi:transcriptional regulator with XRE-family HTH domain